MADDEVAFQIPEPWKLAYAIGTGELRDDVGEDAELVAAGMLLLALRDSPFGPLLADNAANTPEGMIVMCGMLVQAGLLSADGTTMTVTEAIHRLHPESEN